MLRGIIICPDQELRKHIELRIAEVGHVGIVRSVDHYPNELEFVRLIRATGPQIVFLSIESMQHTLAIVGWMEKHFPGVQIMALSRSCEPGVLLELMRVGIREFISVPFRTRELTDALVRSMDLLDKKPPTLNATDLVFSFLPAKAGVGTSTIAINVAAALAKLPDTKILLSDLDLNSGIVRFMMKLDNPYSITDAAEHAGTMDENLWPQLVTSIGNLDVLHAGRLNPEVRVEPFQLRNLLDFARRMYQAICVDLSGNMEKYSFEMMHESKRVFLVCTPEIPSLHLAREKYNFLKNLDLGDKIQILVNRTPKRPLITAAQIEDLMGAKVFMTLPNDYVGVHQALTAGQQIGANTELGRHITQLSHSLMDTRPAMVEQAPAKRFVEYFSLIPARYSLFPGSK